MANTLIVPDWMSQREARAAAARKQEAEWKAGLAIGDGRTFADPAPADWPPADVEDLATRVLTGSRVLADQVAVLTAERDEARAERDSARAQVDHLVEALARAGVSITQIVAEVRTLAAQVEALRRGHSAGI